MQMNVKLIICFNILFAGTAKTEERNDRIQEKQSGKTNNTDKEQTGKQRKEGKYLLLVLGHHSSKTEKVDVQQNDEINPLESVKEREQQHRQQMSDRKSDKEGIKC